MFVINIKNAHVKPALYCGSLSRPPRPVAAASNQGSTTKISIDSSIASAPAALLGNAFSIA
jgi:hypothetical protein